ncbi:MAG TPA: DUF3857 domain-containing protein [Blastocatellia bacterium]|nr:DUF3857 domain-containing protein [Blastocatellia bacterium]
MKSIPAFAFLIIAAAAAFAGDNDWRPVDPALLALKAATVEKDADAEIIFWEVFVDLSSKHTTLSNYVRIKIFTDRGKDSQSKIDLPYLGKDKIEDIAARTIKPDGTVVEMSANAVLERMIIKASGIKLRAKSFVLPAVEVGSVIEYRWREVQDDQFFLQFPFQRDIPIQSVKYYLKVPSMLYANLRTRTFNGRNTAFVKDKDNLYSTTMTNVPAFHQEPDMPPDDQVRTWMLVYYFPNFFDSTPGRIKYEAFKSSTKLNDELRKTAAAIIGDAKTPERKIERLFEFCRSQIKNVERDVSKLTESDISKLKDQKTAADTLKRAWGAGEHINLLFAALANAAGFDARLTQVCDRSSIFFDPRHADPFLQLYFMRSSNVAVKFNDEWRFFDPGSTYVPYGMLRWQEEAQQALILDPLLENFQLTPLSPPEKSLQRRTAKLRLGEDGTLEGDVQMEYSGHYAVEKKLRNEGHSPADRERLLREQVKEQMSTAELSQIRIENVTDPVKPFACAFHVRVPGYAQRTGKRLFLQPGFFQRGVLPRFPASGRTHGVYFRYPWSESDEIAIELPAGFELDNAESIGSMPLSDAGKYEAIVGITKDKRTLVYKRNFVFGSNGRLFFPAGDYGQLKRIYDVVHELDNHTITLKQGAANQPN